MKALKITLLAIVGLLLALLLGLAALLGTQAGSAWLLGRVPGLQVSGFEGRLGGAWQAQRLSWAQDGTQLVVERPELRWSPACLAGLRLCLQRVAAERVALDLPPSGDSADSGPISLPTLKLPLSIELGEVAVGSFLLDGNQQVAELKLAAHWLADGLHIDSLTARGFGLDLALQGRLQPSGDWPLQAEATLGLPAPEGKPWKLAVQVGGELQQALTLKGRSSGYLDGSLEGQLQALAENLPARLLIRADGFKGAAGLPDTLTLNAIQLDASGDLKSGYLIRGGASLPGEGGAVALSLDGRVDAQGADIRQLRLDAGGEQRLELVGRLDWRESLAADATLDWKDFPWLRLYPLAEPPPVTLKTFKAEVHYQDQRYLGNFSAAASGPAGDFTLASPVSGDLVQLNLPSLQLRAGQGQAEGRVTLRFDNGVAWDTALQLSELNPAYWVAELPGSLAGPLRSQGSVRDERLALGVDLDVKGRLRGQPALFQARAEGEGQRWTMGNLDLRLGDNKVQGSGALDQRLQGRLDIALNRLGQLWPQLFGRLDGRLDLAGSLAAPQGRLNLKGQQIAYAEQRIAGLDLQANLDARQNGTLALVASGLRSGETDLGLFKANARGDQRRQQLELDLQGALLKLGLAFDGQLERGNWRGRLARGELSSGGQDWKLQQPARLERLADGRVNFGAHCWVSGAASLCGGEQRLLPEPRLRYTLRDFPLDSLKQWFPEDFAWQGKLNGDLQLDVPARGPSGVVSLDAGSGTLRLRDQGQWVDVGYDSLRLESRLAPNRVDTSLDFRGPKLGELRVQAQIDPRPASKPLSGEFSLAGLDLSLARPFVPMVEKLQGRLNGSGRLSGGLLAPRVDGRVTLSDGNIGGGELPTSFENLSLDARIAGESLELGGGWRSGRYGQGSLSGNLSWGDALNVALNIRGNRLPVVVDPYAQLEVEPDLKIGMAGQELAISGKVLVPRGDITIRQLPPSTVKVSDDAVIVGSEQPEQRPLKMKMDIDVEVGQDKLAFSGFGLSAELAGHLHIGDNLDTRGELNLNKGRYRAYGQRLTIRRARLFFAGPIDQPYLDIEAIRRVDDVVAGLRLTGSAEQPTSAVFSEPAMSQEQALSYLVLGRPMSTGEDSNMLGEAALALALGLAGSAPLTGEIAKQLGIQDFQLDTEGTGNSTSVVASGNITDKLSLRYGVGVFEPANTIALRYQLTKRLYLEAASGLASSLDLFFKRDF
ncbi:translocation/assembly module TamB domain-containing protein [Pseudomonas aeruginosa]|uniref:translocation/assembly module TamB domain-containing protein n=1 Tax=Pseudomonas aeruginosa TaxID=287 RepID=UPI0034596B8F|nr:translocation/assembly module TamB [Pseudomonas aeruginosa]